MIFFIRHNILVKPFDDYNNLNYKDLILLSNQKISPSISPNYIDNSVINNIKKIEINQVFTSKLDRTKETAKLLGFVDFKELDELNEIIFDIETIISEDEYKKHGLAIIRKKLWEFLFLKKNGVEPIEELDNRIDYILKNIDYGKNIIFITHGFLLILIKLKLYGIKIIDLSYDEFISLNILPINYLDGFYIDKNHFYDINNR